MQISDKGNTSLADMRPLFEMHAGMCQALGNQHRLAIMYALKDGEMCVSDLAAALDISVHNVSQHLRILRQHLLVRSRKDGQTVYYSVTNSKLVQACGLIREALLEEHHAEGQSLRAAGLADEMSNHADAAASAGPTEEMTTISYNAADNTIRHAARNVP